MDQDLNLIIQTITAILAILIAFTSYIYFGD